VKAQFEYPDNIETTFFFLALFAYSGDIAKSNWLQAMYWKKEVLIQEHQIFTEGEIEAAT